ncbi:haloacid dehalogenase type II [Halodurantibacterium flavum]|uniref:Haloacid dehalogenase type II n=1 Tax=Halodurantibacterium flavum TaxID=1382802 RepID=A0ABW4S018_9RHOB
MKLGDFKALTFDVYGTLIDWESGMVAGLKPLTDRLTQEVSRNAVLETHARHESAQQAQTPGRRYSELLATVYRRIAEEWGLSVTWDECMRYGDSVGNWPAFPDSADALAYLKQHYKLVVLSNVDNRSFAASNDRLGVDFDAVYTAEDVGSFKPNDANFDYMLRNLNSLGLTKPDILHTAESMFHDHKPANRHGLASAWIYRRHADEGFGATMHPGESPSYDFRFNSMAEMAAAHQAEIRGQ